MILLDTHVLVWLHGGQGDRIPPAVRRRLNAEPLGVSPFVGLELAHLYEVGRVRSPSSAVLEELGPALELVAADVPAAVVCETARGLTWTRDPFDRLISAQAVAGGTTLVTKDEVIREHVPLAWWG
ncbi:MAG: PIN domain-containing protein [Actinomycetota bacterium]|nr:PIN domain-containing protein [Actinomycetota bacterium]